MQKDSIPYPMYSPIHSYQNKAVSFVGHRTEKDRKQIVKKKKPASKNNKTRPLTAKSTGYI